MLLRRLCAVSGHPIPYVNLHLPGTALGTTTDEKGRFYLSSDRPQARFTASFLEYETLALPLDRGDLSGMKIALKPKSQMLIGVQIFMLPKKRKRSPKREDPAYRLSQKIWAREKHNGLERYDQYRYNKYEKLESDLQFLFKKLATSRISGKVFLPLFLNEFPYEVYGQNRSVKRERAVLLANRVAGFEDNQLVIQRTENLYADFDWGGGLSRCWTFLWETNPMA